MSQTEEAMYRLTLAIAYQTVLEPLIEIMVKPKILDGTMARILAEGWVGFQKWQEIRKSWVRPILNNLFPGDSRLIADLEVYAMKRLEVAE